MASSVTSEHKVIPKALTSEVDSLLSENCMRKFYIEYEGYLSNHISHGIIALYRLGATVAQMQRFIEWYQQRLEPASSYLEQKRTVDSEVSVLLGARTDFYTLVDYYETQLKTKYADSMEKLIAESFPLLSTGLAGSALHGLIQLGYGYAAKNSRVVCEGLAYLHFSYIAPRLLRPAGASARPDSLSAVDVANELRNNVQLHEFVSSEMKTEEWQTRVTSNFQRSVGILFLHRGDYMHDLALSVKLPDVNPAERDAGRQLGIWLVNTAMTIYASSSRRNDFFLLHGVTGAWSLLQVLPLLTEYHSIESAVRSYLCALFTVYYAQGTLELQLERLNDPPEKSLSTIVQEVLSGTMEKDEHIFKLIQCCNDMYNETTDPALRNIYTWAAITALNYPLSFE